MPESVEALQGLASAMRQLDIPEEPLSARETVALRIFAAMLSQPGCKIDLYPNLGEKQMQTAFAMADVFLKVSADPPSYTPQ